VVLHRSRADEQLRADLGIGEAIPSKSGYLCLLGREDVARFVGAPARGLSGGKELVAGSLRKRPGPEAAERLVRGSKLLARFEAPVLTSKPLAVHEPRSGQMNRDSAAVESLDRLAVEGFGGFPVAQKRR
jgi:hypothetical protein